MSTLTGVGWTILPDGLSARALAVAVEVAEVAERLRRTETDEIEAAAGCALLYGQLDDLFPERDWAYAAHCLSRSGTRYRKMLAGLDATIVPAATARAEAMANAPAGLAFAAYDVISGLAGTGAYLLSTEHDGALRAVLDWARPPGSRSCRGSRPPGGAVPGQVAGGPG